MSDDQNAQARRSPSGADLPRPYRAAVPAALRALLLGIFVFGCLGTSVELLLLEHTESVAQWVPLALMAVGLGGAAWHALADSRASACALRVLMIAFVLAGLAGIYYHYQGSVEFKLESNPTLRGWPLFRAAMGSKTPPPLAPAVMLQLGMIGLAGTIRGPASGRRL